MDLVQKYLREASLRKLIKEKKIKNPDTGRMIKLSSALSYDIDTAVYRAAIAIKQKNDKTASPVDSKINNKYKEHFKNKIRKELAKLDPEDLADETITLFKNKKIDVKTIRSIFQNISKYSKDDTIKEAIDYIAEVSNHLTDKEVTKILSPSTINHLKMTIEYEWNKGKPTFQDRYYKKFYNKISDLIDEYDDDDWDAANQEYYKDWEENTK